MEKVEFTRCAVAFLDVLGFKTFIEAAERDDSPEGLQFAALQNVITRQLDFVQTDGGKLQTRKTLPTGSITVP